MAKTKEAMDKEEIDNIRGDIQSLKGNLTALSKRIETEGRLSLQEMCEKTRANIANFQDYSKDQLENVEKEIVKHPAQSIALAFGAGVVLSALLRRNS